MESKVSYRTFENKAKQSYNELTCIFSFVYVPRNNVKWQLISDWRTYVPIKKAGQKWLTGVTSKDLHQNAISTLLNICAGKPHVLITSISAFFLLFTFLLSLSLNSRKIVYFRLPKTPLFPNEYRPNVFTWYVQCKAHLIKNVFD